MKPTIKLIFALMLFCLPLTGCDSQVSVKDTNDNASDGEEQSVTVHAEEVAWAPGAKLTVGERKTVEQKLHEQGYSRWQIESIENSYGELGLRKAALRGGINPGVEGEALEKMLAGFGYTEEQVELIKKEFGDAGLKKAASNGDIDKGVVARLRTIEMFRDNPEKYALARKLLARSLEPNLPDTPEEMAHRDSEIARLEEETARLKEETARLEEKNARTAARIVEMFNPNRKEADSDSDSKVPSAAPTTPDE